MAQIRFEKVPYDALLQLQIACANSQINNWAHLARYYDEYFCKYLHLKPLQVHDELKSKVLSHGMSDLDKVDKIFFMLRQLDRKNHEMWLPRDFPQRQDNQVSLALSELLRKCAPQSSCSDPPNTETSGSLDSSFYRYLELNCDPNLEVSQQESLFVDAIGSALKELRLSESIVPWTLAFDWMIEVSPRNQILWALKQPYFADPLRWALSRGGLQPLSLRKLNMCAPIPSATPEDVSRAYEDFIALHWPNLLAKLLPQLQTQLALPLFSGFISKLVYEKPTFENWPLRIHDLTIWKTPEALIRALVGRSDFQSRECRVHFFKCLDDAYSNLAPEEFFYTPGSLLRLLREHHRLAASTFFSVDSEENAKFSRKVRTDGGTTSKEVKSALDTNFQLLLRRFAPNWDEQVLQKEVENLTNEFPGGLRELCDYFRDESKQEGFVLSLRNQLNSTFKVKAVLCKPLAEFLVKEDLFNYPQ